MASDRIITLPNIITFVRLLLIPVSICFLLQDRNIEATLLFALAACTDFLDGMVARRTHTVSHLGQLLDPFVDRVLILAAVIGLLATYRLPLWIVLLVLVRDLYLVIGGMYLMRSRAVRVSVSYIGKASMWLLCIGFAGLMLDMPQAMGAGIAALEWLPGMGSGSYCLFYWPLYLGVVLSLVVAVLYTREGIRALSVPRIDEGGGR